MGHLTWTSDLDTGIDVIDGQHRQIANYINQLYDAQLTRSRSAVKSVIDSLVDYTLSHFSFEEALMEDSGYEFARAHKKVHELFVKRVSDLRLRFDAEEDVVEELHGLLARWLFGHIRNDDAGYVKAVQGMMHSRPAAPSRHIDDAPRSKGWLARSLQHILGRT